MENKWIHGLRLFAIIIIGIEVLIGIITVLNMTHVINIEIYQTSSDPCPLIPESTYWINGNPCKGDICGMRQYCLHYMEWFKVWAIIMILSFIILLWTNRCLKRSRTMLGADKQLPRWDEYDDRLK